VAPPDTRAADEASLRALDTEWSKAAVAKDLDRSVAYLADDTMMLPPNAPPVNGKEAVRKFWSDMLALPGLALSWQTTKAEAAKSGDLGYTWGTYEMTVNDAKGNPNTDRGKYLTVWKKQPDGAWKCLVDSFSSDLPVPAAK
jgi:ketosteroid isomerase-like protein